MRHLHKGLVWVYVQYMNLKYLQGAYSLPLSGWLVTWLNRAGLWLTETAVDKSKFLAQRLHTSCGPVLVRQFDKQVQYCRGNQNINFKSLYT